MKKVLALVLCLVCVAAFAACGGNGSSGGALGSIGDAIGNLLSGDTTGKIGETYHTQWFAFQIDSIDRVSEYAGHTAAEGNELIDVVLVEKNIFGEPIPLGTFDFYVDSDTFAEYEWPIDPLDNTMMPMEFDLAKDEEVTYHMVYEVPAGLTDLKVMYTEINEDEEIGATFTVNVPN